MRITKNLASSFRDPSGFVFTLQKNFYRQINLSYKNDYERFRSSGLQRTLISEGFLIPHKEVSFPHPKREKNFYKIICSETIPFVSYPYEWCFSELKDAAIITLDIQKRALEYGMILKDASAYNVQFIGSRPIFIDTLSFEIYQKGKPWIAYKQFCKNFLAPLALMSYHDSSLVSLMKDSLDGIPLPLASDFLPLSSYLNVSLLINLHLQAKFEKKFFVKPPVDSKIYFSEQKLKGLIANLESAISSLKFKDKKSLWSSYYKDAKSYSEIAAREKYRLVSDLIDIVKPQNAWDIGANTGLFSQLCAQKGVYTIAVDLDYQVIENLYQKSKELKSKNILPLRIDITNASPSLGWDNAERVSFVKRGPVNLILALAISHHLVITNNLPLTYLSGFFKKLCDWLIIEFVPETDSQVKQLIAAKEGKTHLYFQAEFEKNFSQNFSIVKKIKLENSERFLYLMKNKNCPRK